MRQCYGWMGLVAGLVVASTVHAIDIGISIRPDSITVGDSVTVELRLEPPAGSTVTFPRPQTPPRVMVLGVDAPQPAAGTWTARYKLAVFDVGDVVLPPWPVQVKADTQSSIVYTDSIRLYVTSVLDDSLAVGHVLRGLVKPGTSQAGAEADARLERVRAHVELDGLGELRALRWSDVNLAESVLRVERGWDDSEGEIDGKTRAARRTGRATPRGRRQVGRDRWSKDRNG